MNIFPVHTVRNLLLGVLLLFTACLPLPAAEVFTNGENLSFVRIGSDQGLSESNVKCILQDSYGFIWFGTKNGLDRYDGVHMKEFDVCDRTNGHSNHNVSALFEAADRRLWVGTDNGVFIYSPVEDSFRFFGEKADDGVIIQDWIAQIIADAQGNIWIVAPGQGTFLYREGQLYHYDVSRDEVDEGLNNLCVLDNGEVWACSWHGLYRFSSRKNVFEQVTEDSRGHSLLNIEFNTLCRKDDWLVLSVQSGGLMKYNYRNDLLEPITLQDFSDTYVRNATVLDDEIWVGTHNGLYVLNEKTQTVRHYMQDLKENASLSDNVVYCIYKDREEGVWVGTMFGGVNYLPKRKYNFKRYRPTGEAHALSSKRVRELAEDNKGNLWVGTEDHAVDILSIKEGTFSRHHSPTRNGKMDIALALYAHRGKMYVSYFKEGLEVVDENGQSTYFSNHQLSLAKSIYALYIDHEETIWVAVDYGIFYIPKGSMKLHLLKGTEEIWFYDIAEEEEGVLWFTTMGRGVWRYDLQHDSLTNFMHEEGDPTSLSSRSVSSVMRDSKGTMWFSTDRGGICRYNKRENNFTRFSTEEGLPDNVAYKILEDDKGFLWFGTNQGLVKLNPENGDVRVFTTADGLCGNQFNYKSALKGSDGRFYFGGVEGLISFDPNVVQTTQMEAPLYITQLLLMNKEVAVATENSPLQQNIILTDKISLPREQTNLSVDVALLSYASPQAHDYYYQLEPLDDQWIHATSGRVSYANLPPGEYKLNICAYVDKDSPQRAMRSLTIRVRPAWYESKWAFTAYLLLFLAGFAQWFFYYRRRKNRQMQEQQRVFEIEKEKELYEKRVNIFTDIAHEIRTPLTLINGPLEVIQEMDVKDPKLSRQLDVIAQNTRRLLNLASQLLDFKKVDANRLKLNWEVVNIPSLVQETVDRFEPTFTHRGKVLETHLEGGDFSAKIDREAVTKILSNLFNNALKYGQRNICIALRKDEETFVVSVTSDGERIPDDKREQIFQPFFQMEDSRKEKQGVGIGLSLARSLAGMHGGKLELDAENPLNEFVLTLPLNLAPEDMQTEILQQAEAPLAETALADENACGQTILIVEDEENILAFMKERLEEFFGVETATNGKEALEMLHRGNIDLIITDIMMPVMNGMELCATVKADINLCHTPVIFLTAKNDIDSKVKGLQVGAEAYIEKPFSFEYLKTQVYSILNNRQKEREAFSKRPFFPLKNMQMSKEDEDFCNRVLEVIDKNIADESFNVERMAEELYISRSSLLRKIKTLFNQSPIDFIRLIRLKKAAELIQEGKFRVGEICFMVGFSSHSYFSKLFSKQFGMTPKDFEKQISEDRKKNRVSHEISLENLLSATPKDE